MERAVLEGAARGVAVRAARGDRGSRCALARALLAMTQEEFSRAFSKSPMKRAKLRGLKRNAAVVLGNPPTGSGQAAHAEDVEALARAFDEEPDHSIREHAAWALARLERRGGS